MTDEPRFHEDLKLNEAYLKSRMVDSLLAFDGNKLRWPERLVEYDAMTALYPNTELPMLSERASQIVDDLITEVYELCGEPIKEKSE